MTRSAIAAGIAELSIVARPGGSGPRYAPHELLDISGVSIEDPELARDIADPFTRYPPHPAWATDEEAGIIGPGHHRVAPGLAADRLIFYHSIHDLRPDPAFHAERRIRYAPVDFDADGWIFVVPWRR